jgi:elongation factor G
MATPPQQIRNVAIVGARGSGKTTLFEALLYEAGVLQRMGTVEEGTTFSDSEPEERARKLSLSTALVTLPWQDHLLNLLDTPGEPSFIADALAALAVCEAAILVVNGQVGVEVQTVRLWERCRELGLATLLFVNMLDREEADFFAVLEALKEAFGPHLVATELPLRDGGALAGVIDLIDMRAFRHLSPERGRVAEEEIPPDQLELAQQQRERLMDEVAELSDALMERYLEGEEIDHREVVAALEEGTNRGTLFPCVCGAAAQNLGTARLLQAIVEDLPSPVEHPLGGLGGVDAAAFVFKTRADPYAGRVNLLRVFSGKVRHDSHLFNPRAAARERIGQLVQYVGKEVVHVDELGEGEMGAVAKLKETRGGDWLIAGEGEPPPLALRLPKPAMAFACRPKGHADEEKMLSALKRIQEEDPAIDLYRDPQTGEQIVAGLSQLQVEVLVERLARRFGVEVELAPPLVPYRETIRRPASGHGRHKKQTGGRGQFGDCRIEIEPIPVEQQLEFVDEIKGGVIPGQFIPGVEKGVREAMASGILAGYPVTGIKVRLVDGAHHPVDSSELAFKIAGSLALKEALRAADPVLLEPVMLLTAYVPEECVGDVLGDLNARRGRPQGMEPRGRLVQIKAEVPLAEVLSYGNDLRGITGGRGDYTLELLRYEPVPEPVAARLLSQRRGDAQVAA